MITFTYSLLLLVGVLSIVPVFCGLVWGGSLGRVCHSGEVVSHRDASRDDPFHSWRKPSWSHTYNAWWIPMEHTRNKALSSGYICQILVLPTLVIGTQSFVNLNPHSILYQLNSRLPLGNKSDKVTL